MNINTLVYGDFRSIKDWLLARSKMSNEQYREEYPLQYCAQHGNIFEMKKLVKNMGYNINYVDYNGNSPLMIACQHGKLEIVNYLLNFDKLKINQVNYAGNDALLIACIENRYNIVKAILQSNFALETKHKDESGNYLLHLIAEIGDYDTLGLIAEYVGNPDVINKKGNTALLIAASLGHVNQVKDLIDCGVDINFQNPLTGETALFKAAEAGHYDVINVLLYHKADKNIKNEFGETAWYIACHNRHLPVAKLLGGIK